jgi:hypothetical protein
VEAYSPGTFEVITKHTTGLSLTTLIIHIASNWHDVGVLMKAEYDIFGGDVTEDL